MKYQVTIVATVETAIEQTDSETLAEDIHDYLKDARLVDNAFEVGQCEVRVHG